ncbi:thymic stromal cotransporter homolog isoform X2 [Xenopus tropicalis]|uniref:Thymic stromal cotransporter homolog isoform X2 n=1 Tax=Xenopus tropicalis TaxID=8364 RepID=A0A8J1JX34_XENTR|nr:thymic stromal cotransporter homolog isoform X2 [Xenopus tropicalis]
MSRTWIEPVVAGAQIASSFYDTGLLLVVKSHYNQSSLSSNSTSDDEEQNAISNFYLIHNLILALTPILSAYILANIGDKKSRKVPICVPLLGYFVSRMFLLFVILFNWPIEVMFGSAALNGLTGFFTTYWAGVLAVASLGSSESKRSVRIIIIELVYGVAGFVGSLVSGHIFKNFDIANQKGSVLVILSLCFYAFSLIYSLFIFKIPRIEETGPGNTESTETSTLLMKNPTETSTANGVTMTSSSKVFLVLLFLSAILYNAAVGGAVDVLPFFIIKEPLSWGAVEVGYANAAGYLIFVTSFLGVYFFSKRLTDFVMIGIGILSFSAGIFIMGFVQWTFLFYVGKVFVVLQLLLSITHVVTLISFTKLYQASLKWFHGLCFILASIIALLSLIPIRIAAYMHQSRTTIMSSATHTIS